MAESEASLQSYRERGLAELLNHEVAEGVNIVEHGEDPPRATRTYMLSLNIGWAESVIATGMYLHDARGIAYILADALDCAVGDVEDPAGG